MRAPETPQLLERAFALLAIFDEARPEWTTTEAAHEVGLPVPTAHRILGVLEREGFLARDEDSKRFTLGRASLSLGRRAQAVLALDRVAAPFLERISALTDEVALLTELNQRRDGVVCSIRVESSGRSSSACSRATRCRCMRERPRRRCSRSCPPRPWTRSAPGSCRRSAGRRSRGPIACASTCARYAAAAGRSPTRRPTRASGASRSRSSTATAPRSPRSGWPDRAIASTHRRCAPAHRAPRECADRRSAARLQRPCAGPRARRAPSRRRLTAPVQAPTTQASAATNDAAAGRRGSGAWQPACSQRPSPRRSRRLPACTRSGYRGTTRRRAGHTQGRARPLAELDGLRADDDRRRRARLQPRHAGHGDRALVGRQADVVAAVRAAHDVPCRQFDAPTKSATKSDAGRRRSAAACRPGRGRPRSSTPTRSDIANASSWSCVT